MSLKLRYSWLLIALLQLSACTTLPPVGTEVPARHPKSAVRFTDARGPLSVAQSQAILARLGNKGQASGVFERHLAVEQELAGTSLTAGNHVRLLQNGPATYSAMLTAIAQAKDHINMETYILEDDPIGQQFAQALIDKQRQGVQVQLIHDSLGTVSTPALFFQRLTDSGVRVVEFNPINPMVAGKAWALNQRDHRKLLIIDGKVAFLGGINISGVYSSSSFGRSSSQPSEQNARWRDTDIQVAGPVVADFQRLFLASWAAQNGPALEQRNWYPKMGNVGTDVVRSLSQSPEESGSPIYATLISAINSAEHSVCLTNAYFVPDPQLLAALEAAAGRGVDVKLILPGKTDSWLTFHAGRRLYSRLLHAGIKVFERNGVILHAKTALIDGVWTTIGSSNLDWRSFVHNYELNAVIVGAQFGQQMQQAFDKDLADSTAITLAAWDERPVGTRLKEWFAGVWEYWL